MAIILRAHDIFSRISRRYPENTRKNCLLRFDNQVSFSERDSYLKSALQLIELVSTVESEGFEVLGGYTDRGIHKLMKNVANNVHEFLHKKRGNVGFVNLYCVYFCRVQPPSGILAVVPHRLIFIPGLIGIDEELIIDYTDQPFNRKQAISHATERLKLRWWGDVRNPVVFRDCEVDSNNIKGFLRDTRKFFDEIGYAEV